MRRREYFLKLIGEINLAIARRCEDCDAEYPQDLLCRINDAIPEMMVDNERLEEEIALFQEDLNVSQANLKHTYQSYIEASEKHEAFVRSLLKIIPQALRDRAGTCVGEDLLFECLVMAIPAWCAAENVPLEWPDDEDEFAARNDEAAGEQVVVEQAME